YASEIDRRLPGEVITLVLALRHIDVGMTRAAAARTGTVEEQQMPIGRQVWDGGVETKDINDRAQILGRSPLGVAARSLRDPDFIPFGEVRTIDASRPVRSEVQAQPIRRDRRVKVVVK